MDDYEREMEIIALLSNVDESYTYVTSSSDVIDHACGDRGEERKIKLIEVEYFREAGLRTDRANFCDRCKTVFVYNTER